MRRILQILIWFSLFSIFIFFTLRALFLNITFEYEVQMDQFYL